SAKSWKTRPMERCSGGRKTLGPAISRSLRSTRPVSWLSIPAAMRKSVVLPEPDGPRRHSTSPGSAASVTSSSVSAPGAKRWLMRSSTRRAANVTPAVTRAGFSTVSLILQRAHPFSRGQAPRQGSIILDSRCQQAELFQIDIRQRVLIVRKGVGIDRGRRNGEVRRHARRKQTRALEFVETRKLAQLLKPEMV